MSLLFVAGSATTTPLQQETAFSSSFVLSAARDFVLTGGAQIESNPLNSIRSGNPKSKSSAAFKVPLAPGISLSHVSFEYSYTVGFAHPNATGSNFSVRAAGKDTYTSPHFTDCPYSKAYPNYSKPIAVDAPVSIKVPATGDSRIEIDFDNNDENVQLLLPLKVTVTCTGGPCANFPLLPTFIDSNMVLQRAPQRANVSLQNGTREVGIFRVITFCFAIRCGVATLQPGSKSLLLSPQEQILGKQPLVQMVLG